MSTIDKYHTERAISAASTCFLLCLQATLNSISSFVACVWLNVYYFDYLLYSVLLLLFSSIYPSMWAQDGQDGVLSKQSCTTTTEYKFSQSLEKVSLTKINPAKTLVSIPS